MSSPASFSNPTPGGATGRGDSFFPDRVPGTALVTGAARGIGAAIALHLAARGVRVAVHYRSSQAEAEAVMRECNALTPGAVMLQGDLTDAADAARVAAEAEAALGGVELLVNNIGNYLRKTLLELTPEEWKDQVESNLSTCFFMCRFIVPAMQARGFGRVVNIGYAGSQQAFYNHKTVPYHIAKTGVNMLTRNLGALTARSGVTVNCLGMGVIENSIRKPDDIPAGRVGSFADVCNALDFLLLPSSGYINGTQIDVSGGWLPEQMLTP